MAYLRKPPLGAGRFVARMAAAVLALGLASAEAAEPPTRPFLQIETGHHVAYITRFTIDPAERVMATTSYDKTLRLWSLKTGELLRTFRVPVGDGLEGALYSASFSPDGKWLATGGWTCAGNGGWCFYIFDAATGEIVRRVRGLPHRALFLVYSPDGKRLAAAMKGGAGVRVYDTENFEIQFQDRYAKGGKMDTTWASFSRQGRLITVSRDGLLRLYDRRYRRTVIKAPETDPISASFSPDGKLVAIGYNGSPKVSVHNAADLTFAFAPDTRGVETKGSFSRLAWSKDGKFLYGGGGHERAGRRAIRRWAKGGRGRPTDMAIERGWLTHLATYGKDGVAYTNTQPALGALRGAEDTNGAGFVRRPVIADFSEIGERFLISPDGKTVALAFEPWGGKPAVLSIAERRLTPGAPRKGHGLLAPITSAPGLDIRLWKGTEPPELNGKKLKLAEHEEPVSLAIAPDRRGFFIGTGWRLYHFDARGKERWRLEVPGGAKGVNVTEDSKIVVAALGDGTVRWYRARDGKPLLSFFPHRDRRRWVAWTPSGYYMASPGGDTLVGWQVNRGAERAADFFSVARFRHIYYRPDVVEKVLALRDEGEAVRKAEADGRPKAPRDVAEILPPVVTVRALAGGTRIANPRLTLDITVRSPKGKPVAAIQVRAGGRPIASLEGDPAAPGGETRHRIPIYLPRRDTSLEIIALGAGGVASEPATLRLVWSGPRRQEKPRLYILAVGVSKYRDAALRLELAAKDAADFAAILERQEGRAFGAVRVRVLRDKQADRRSLRQGLDWLAGAAGRRDVAVLFLAGHGVDDPTAGYFFMPYDARRDAVAASGLSYTEIRRAMSRIPGRSLLFVDTCRAGDVWGRPGEPSTDIDRIVNDLGSPEYGVVVFASSTGRQVSYESDAWNNGAFTKALVEGIGGRADVFGDGQVTVTTLDAYVANRVSKLTKGRQTPATGKPVGADLLLAVLR